MILKYTIENREFFLKGNSTSTMMNKAESSLPKGFQTDFRVGWSRRKSSDMEEEIMPHSKNEKSYNPNFYVV